MEAKQGDHEGLPKAFKEIFSCGNGKPPKGFKPCGDKIRDFVLFFLDHFGGFVNC